MNKFLNIYYLEIAMPFLMIAALIADNLKVDTVYAENIFYISICYGLISTFFGRTPTNEEMKKGWAGIIAAGLILVAHFLYKALSNI